MPSRTFTYEAAANVPADRVWKLLDRPDTWQAIGSVDRVLDPEIDKDGRLLEFSFETVAAGKRYVGIASPKERVEGKRIAWNVQSPELRGVTSVTLTPTETGTTVSVSLHVEGVGVLSSMLLPIIAAAIGSGLPNAVDGFAAGFTD